MAWDDIRKSHQSNIRDIQKSIDEQLELWAKTGNETHLLFAKHQIRHLVDIKEYIKGKENEAKAVSYQVPSEQD